MSKNSAFARKIQIYNSRKDFLDGLIEDVIPIMGLWCERIVGCFAVCNFFVEFCAVSFISNEIIYYLRTKLDILNYFFT